MFLSSNGVSLLSVSPSSLELLYNSRYFNLKLIVIHYEMVKLVQGRYSRLGLVWHLSGTPTSFLNILGNKDGKNEQ